MIIGYVMELTMKIRRADKGVQTNFQELTCGMFCCIVYLTYLIITDSGDSSYELSDINNNFTVLWSRH